MWIVFQQVKALVGDAQRGNRAGLLLADLKALLSADEVNKMLSEGLTDLTRKAGELLRVAPVEPPRPPTPPTPDEAVLFDEVKELRDGGAAAKQLRKLADTLEAAQGEGGEVRVKFQITAWKRRPRQ